MHVKQQPYSGKDADRIESALLPYRTKTALRKDWFHLVDVDKVLDAVLTGDENSCIVDDSYLVVFAVGRPWYGSTVLVEEKLVLRLPGATASFSSVTALLDRIAASTSAAGVVVGTALAPVDEALARLYKRQGYSTQSQSLAKFIQE